MSFILHQESLQPLTAPPETTPATATSVVERHGLTFIFISVMIDSIGIGLILPVLPALITELTQGSIAEAARWGGALTLVYALMQFVFNPLIGSLSDAYGRKPVLLLSLAALCVDYVIMALAPTLVFLFIGRLLAGIFGATFATARAYIADITPREERAARFGLIGAAFGMGFIFGPAIGGLLGEFSPRAPFYAAAAFAGINCLYGLVVVPESLPRKNRRTFQWARSNPFGALKSVARFPAFGGLLLACTVYEIAHYVYPAVWSYYGFEAFAWSPREVGYSLAAFGIAFTVSQGFLMKPILARFGAHRTLIFTLVINVAVLVALGLATKGWMIYVGLPFAAFGAISGPTLDGILSDKVPADSQGELQGVLSSLTSISVIISPVLMSQVFAVFSGDAPLFWLPGAPFLLAALLMLVTLIAVMVSLRRFNRLLEKEQMRQYPSGKSPPAS